MNTPAAKPANGNGNGAQQVAVLHPPRLPYHQLIEERFGVDKASWKALTEAIYPNAKSTDSVVMALSYCRARKLDPFKRPVHIVPMWSSAARSMVETVWPGISELRTTAFRTGQYAGKDETEFGPSVEHKFEGRHNNEDRQSIVTFPEWGRVRMKRVLDGVERTFVSPKVYWLETYGRWGGTTVPNDMWAKRPFGQLEKCVEAAGLRCAFPEEIGNDYAAEEMEGRVLDAGDPAKPIAERPVTLSAALDELARTPGASAPAEAQIVGGVAVDGDGVVLEHQPDHEAERAAEAENEGREAEATPKRPVRIDLELALRNTASAREVLTFLQENAERIGTLGKEDRKLFDTAVLQHQDDLKKPSKD